MPGIEWADALDIIESYVVKIESPGGSGTGFFVDKINGMPVIATAFHVVDYANKWRQPIKISSSGESVFLEYDSRVIPTAPNKDSALIITRKGLLSLPDTALPFIEEGKRLRDGVQIGWCGYPFIAPNNLCFFSGRVSTWLKESESYLVDGVAINGVSGSPAFNVHAGSKPRLIGMLTAYIPSKATGESLPGVSFIRSIKSCLSLLDNVKDQIDKMKKTKR